MHRRTLLAAAAAGAVLPRVAIGQPASARVLKIVPQANLTLLDPIFTTAAITAWYSYNVFDTLFAVDSKMRPHPQMAEGFTVSDDGRTYLIKLRPGLKFHDGEPVRAQDAAPSLARWAARDTMGQTVATFVEAWEAADDRTVRVKLKSPLPVLIDAIAKPASVIPFIMPERMAKTDPMRQVTETIGSGPYRFLKDEFNPGSHVAFSKFADYVPRQEAADWASGGKQVHFERIEWKIIPDAATAAAALQSGEIDWWEQALADLVPSLKRRPDITVDITDPTGYIGVIRFNHLQKPMDNVGIRRAIMAAVNQDDYMRAVTGNNTEAFRQCKALFPCGTPYGSEIGAAAMPGDLGRARDMLKAAGYAGEKVVIINPTDFPTIGPFGEVTADLLKKLGMNVELQSMDWGTLVQRRVSKEPTDKGGWSMFHSWWTGVSIANPVLSAIIRGQGNAGWFGWFDNARAEQLTAEWLKAPDDAARNRLADDIQRNAFDNVPTIPLGQFFINTAYRKSITGVKPGPAPFMWGVRRV